MKKIFRKIENIGFKSSRITAIVFTFGINDFEPRKKNDYLGRIVFTVLGWVPIIMILFVIIVLIISLFK